MGEQQRVFALSEFIAQERQRLADFEFSVDGGMPWDPDVFLTADGWVERYNGYLAGMESGEIPEPPAPSNRRLEWERFSDLVSRHIEEYTVPQYGDAPDDQLSAFDEHDIITQMRRYMNRADSNARGPEEAQRDMLKLAHYVAVLYMKRAGLDMASALAGLEEVSAHD